MQPDLHSRFSIFYLAIPNLLFLLSWPSLPIKLAVTPLFLLATYFTAIKPISIQAKSEAKPVVILFVCSLAIMLFSGCAHLFYANFDWYVRDAVYADLIKQSWPVNYSNHLFLRAPIGYYLFPSLISSLTSSHWIWSAVLTVWSAIGLTLVLWPIAKETSIKFSLFVLLIFAGANWLGYRLLNGHFSEPGSILLNWWAVKYQYTPFVTGLLWVPNHLLPAFIVASLLCKDINFQQKTFAVFLSALWSPFALIGGAILLAAMSINQWRNIVWITLIGLLFTPIIVYLTQDISEVGHGSIWKIFPTTFDETKTLLLFLVIQLLPFMILLSLRLYRPLIYVSFSLLLFLPLVHYGAANDLVMRVSFVPLYILYFYFAKTVYELKRRNIFIATCTALAIWSLPATWHELHHIINMPKNTANYQGTTVQATLSLPQYARNTEDVDVSSDFTSYLASNCDSLGALLLSTCQPQNTHPSVIV